MNTTSLFVELIVIGVGAFVALLLLTLALFGTPTSLAPLLLSFQAWLLALPLIYLFGIVIDRLADRSFSRRWESELLREVGYDSEEEFFEHRRIVMHRSAPFSEQLDYGRSRLRICRGWVLNTILLLVSWLGFLFLQLREVDGFWGLVAYTVVVALALVWTSFLAWRHLAVAEYRKVRRQAEWLEKNPAYHLVPTA